MEQESLQVPYSLSQEELERTMRTLEPVYDMVRIVDPSHTAGRTLSDDGDLAMPHTCFDVLNKGRRCKNCISARTVACHRSVSKFEFVGDDAFYISTRYIEVDGKPRSLELIKQITGNTLMSSDDKNGATKLKELVENDERERYRDEVEGAFSRAYLEEGINTLTTRRLALLQLTGLDNLEQAACDPRQAAGDPTRSKILSLVAKSVLQGIRNEDTLVHYERNTFAILFENIPAQLFPERLNQIFEQVHGTLVLDAKGRNVGVIIGGVAQEGSVQELLQQAKTALEQARTTTQPVVIVGDESGETPSDELNPTMEPELGAHARYRTDALTRMPLTHLFRKALQHQIDVLGPDDDLCVVHVDVENFKAFNRAYGLPEGDVLLVSMADAIRAEFPNDLTTRSGIDMFDVATRRSDVVERTEHLRKRLADLRRDVALELKIGIAHVTDAGMESRDVMDRAKIACDSIKGKYDKGMRVFDEDLAHAVSMHDHIVKSLDEAISNGYIRPYYQAIVRSFTGNACSVEALSRWDDPVFGTLSPIDVIPTLEQRHLIHKHDVHIARCVCSDLRAAIDKGLPVVPVSINLSRLDFQLCDIFREVEDAVQAYGIDRELLDIEVTESTLDKSNEFFRPHMDRFRKAGYEIWMDDFGSGYSSLNLLKDYEFDVLKIDMAFLRGLESNAHSREIISSIVDMAKRIGIRTLAEGVETEAQFQFLKTIGCEMVQGYLFSKPAPDSLELLSKERGVESASDRAYFESVGRVNLLSQQPLEDMAMATDEASRGMPLAIVEWDGAVARYLTANEAFQKQIPQSEASEQLLRTCLADGRAQLVAKNGAVAAYLVIA
ncbi:MAG: EAL domain-containing protein [Atopobiaceae bacterium]|nr:EAL domain-containing protein [Atopobiaceae bacterium]